MADVSVMGSLSQAELRVFADATIAPGHQATLHELLEKNRRGALSVAEEAELDRLLEEVDQVVLLKARARYILGLMGLSERVV